MEQQQQQQHVPSSSSPSMLQQGGGGGGLGGGDAIINTNININSNNSINPSTAMSSSQFQSNQVPPPQQQQQQPGFTSQNPFSQSSIPTTNPFASFPASFPDMSFLTEAASGISSGIGGTSMAMSIPSLPTDQSSFSSITSSILQDGLAGTLPVTTAGDPQLIPAALLATMTFANNNNLNLNMNGNTMEGLQSGSGNVNGVVGNELGLGGAGNMTGIEGFGNTVEGDNGGDINGGGADPMVEMSSSAMPSTTTSVPMPGISAELPSTTTPVTGSLSDGDSSSPALNVNMNIDISMGDSISTTINTTSTPTTSTPTLANGPTSSIPQPPEQQQQQQQHQQQPESTPVSTKPVPPTPQEIVQEMELYYASQRFIHQEKLQSDQELRNRSKVDERVKTVAEAAKVVARIKESCTPKNVVKGQPLPPAFSFVAMPRTDEELLELANTSESLCPIRLDLEIEGIKIKDSFVWNVNEPFFTPYKFAEILCEDFKLPSQLFAATIAKAIQDQIDEYYDHPLHGGKGITTGRDNEGYAVTDAPDLRVVIKLDITIGGVSLIDSFEWDINCEKNSPEVFADTLITDLGLGLEFKTAIVHAIREQVQIFQKSLFLLEHPFDNTPVDDDELAGCFLKPLTSGVRAPPNIYYEPYLLQGRELEQEKGEKDRERDARRKRRQTGRNRRMLPDRDLPKINRTQLPHPASYSISSTAGHHKRLITLANNQAAAAAASGGQAAFGGISGTMGTRRKTRSETASEAVYGGFKEEFNDSIGTSMLAEAPLASVRNAVVLEWTCLHCKKHASKTALIRHGPQGPNTLCNECGLTYSRTGTLPPQPKTEVKSEDGAPMAPSTLPFLSSSPISIPPKPFVYPTPISTVSPPRAGDRKSNAQHLAPPGGQSHKKGAPPKQKGVSNPGTPWSSPRPVGRPSIASLAAAAAGAGLGAGNSGGVGGGSGSGLAGGPVAGSSLFGAK
ncbi:SWI/SNF chromatin-remodeling complex subunit [Blyttiomyces sp. JEL0837]|nr:SWI/SNF chromatin-remodeling complex subunit [Blyttiomyces sp. JEL0837]